MSIIPKIIVKPQVGNPLNEAEHAEDDAHKANTPHLELK